MRCLLCLFQLVLSLNPRKQSRKCLISYYKTSVITCLLKHFNVDHPIFSKKFKNKLIVKGEEILK
jgi:hypothetical protein